MTNARILVVDDENDIRELVREILSEEGYTVETAGNAAEARAACAQQAPDLVLLDIWMPDTDGISLLREWQQSQALTAPVVMMSVTARSKPRSRPRGSVRSTTSRSRSRWPSCCGPLRARSRKASAGSEPHGRWFRR